MISRILSNRLKWFFSKNGIAVSHNTSKTLPSDSHFTYVFVVPRPHCFHFPPFRHVHVLSNKAVQSSLDLQGSHIVNQVEAWRLIALSWASREIVCFPFALDHRVLQQMYMRKNSSRDGGLGNAYFTGRKGTEIDVQCGHTVCLTGGEFPPCAISKATKSI